MYVPKGKLPKKVVMGPEGLPGNSSLKITCFYPEHQWLIDFSFVRPE